MKESRKNIINERMFAGQKRCARKAIKKAVKTAEGQTDADTEMDVTEPHLLESETFMEQKESDV